MNLTVIYISFKKVLNTAGELIACCEEFLKILSDVNFVVLWFDIGSLITFFSGKLSSIES